MYTEQFSLELKMVLRSQTIENDVNNDYIEFPCLKLKHIELNIHEYRYRRI